MAKSRRVFLKEMAAGGLLMLGGCATGGGQSTAPAAKGGSGGYPDAAFDASSERFAIGALYPNLPVVASKSVVLDVPVIAESSLSVPVRVTTSLKEIETLSLLVTNNFNPLAAHFVLVANVTDGEFDTRIKIEKTSDVVALIKSGSQVHMARAEVKVVGALPCG